MHPYQVSTYKHLQMYEVLLVQVYLVTWYNSYNKNNDCSTRRAVQSYLLSICLCRSAFVCIDPENAAFSATGRDSKLCIHYQFVIRYHDDENTAFGAMAGNI